MSALAVEVLTAIYAAGGTVRIAGEDRLKVIAPGPLPNALMDRLRAVKPDVTSLLPANPSSWPCIWRRRLSNTPTAASRRS
jgi:hypothetical protein